MKFINIFMLTYDLHDKNSRTGNWKDRLQDKFLGKSLQLKSPNVLINTVDRFELLTQSMGTVIVHLHILSRNFDKFGCQL